MKGTVKIFSGNNHQSNMTYLFCLQQHRGEEDILTSFEQHFSYAFKRLHPKIGRTFCLDCCLAHPSQCIVSPPCPLHKGGGEDFSKMALMGGWKIFTRNGGKPEKRGWFFNGGIGNF